MSRLGVDRMGINSNPEDATPRVSIRYFSYGIAFYKNSLIRQYITVCNVNNVDIKNN